MSSHTLADINCTLLIFIFVKYLTIGVSTEQPLAMMFSLKLYAYRNIIVLLYGHVIYFVQFGNKKLPSYLPSRHYSLATEL